MVFTNTHHHRREPVAGRAVGRERAVAIGTINQTNQRATYMINSTQRTRHGNRYPRQGQKTWLVGC